MAFKGTTISNPLTGSSENAFGILRVLVSTNCGQTWQPRKTISDSALATAGVGDTNAFVPTSQSQWREEVVSALNNIGNNPNVMFKFEFINKGGNNFFIDDINVYNNNTGINDDLIQSLNLNIFPNPVTENTIISFELNKNSHVNMAIYDVLGKEVLSLLDSYLIAGMHQMGLNKNKLVAGTYFLNLSIDNQTVVKPLIVY